MEKPPIPTVERHGKFAKRTTKHWFELLFKGGLTIGGIVKTCDIVNQINTNQNLRYEILTDQSLIHQYFRELSMMIQQGVVNQSNFTELLGPTLGVACVAAPIAFGLSLIVKNHNRRQRK